MRTSSILMALLIISLLAPYGCGKIVEPYESDYQCPQAEHGQCAPVETAYGQAVYESGRKRGVDLNEAEEGELEDLLDQLKSCAKSKSSTCMKKTERAIIALYESAEARGREAELSRQIINQQHAKTRAYDEMAMEGRLKPLRSDRTIMHVVVLPYQAPIGNTGETALVSDREAWIVVDEGQWVIQRPNGTGKSRRLLGVAQ